MSYYQLCSRSMGRHVHIRTNSGKTYRGRISQVTPTHVYLTPMGRTVSGKDTPKEMHAHVQTADTTTQKREGEEIVWWGFGWWIPFFAITALAFLPFFFW